MTAKKPHSGRPVVGITLDAEPAGGYSKFPWYALRENYGDSIREAGGLPVALPHEPELAEDYLGMIDALVVTGGAFDVDPSLYGDSTTHPTVILKQRRTRFEWSVTRGAFDRGMPILGICGGQQLLNVVLGGTLVQHIPDSIENALAHEQPNPRDEPGHDVTIVEGTLLHRLTGTTRLAVNSAHHQAVAEPGKDCIVSARAEDGVIEAIEHPGHPFCLGVQWHPEFLITGGDRAILEAFIEAARS
ncbi:MAG: gamma-glutamyl-gamma-aminobutyrate hydrolase family protein [Geminicoccaceae bacterium]